MGLFAWIRKLLASGLPQKRPEPPGPPRVKPDLRAPEFLPDPAPPEPPKKQKRRRPLTPAQRQALERFHERRRERAEKRRAEARKRRRGDDILYLGPGVSAGLSDRAGDPEKLKRAGLPILNAPADVAAALGVTVPQLRWLAYHSPAARTTHYARFEIPKRSGGGMRPIWAPLPHMRRAQAWILENILRHLPAEPPAHGFVRGRSILSNASAHSGRPLVVKLDLVEFFPSVTFPRVAGLFRSLGYSPAAATVLALLCTEGPRHEVALDGETLWAATGPRALPQGACTSPAISNLVARRLDRRMAGMAAKAGWSYTRYADDLTFSGDGRGRVGGLLARARHIVEDEGFALNPRKLRVMGRNAAQEVTGLVVNDRPAVPRRIRRRLRAILHRTSRDGLESQNRSGRPNFEAHVRGWLAYVTMVRPEHARALRGNPS